MSLQAVATFGFQAVGDGISVSFTPASAFTFTNPNAPPPSAYQLVAGANPVTVELGTLYGVYIRPQPGANNGKTLKGITGDTGVKMHPTCIFFLALDPTQSSFVIASIGSELIQLYWD